MQLSDFTLRIILIFIPGVISFIIIDKLTTHKEPKLHQILINSFVLGFLCYCFYYLVTLLIGISLKINLRFLFFEVLTNKDTPLNFKEIILVTGLSFPMGFIFAFLINYKILHRIAHIRIKNFQISNKFGDVDVWSYIMNSKMPEWVVVRDIENDLMYEGWVEAFSDSTEKDELFLRDVKVYKNSTADELYAVPGLYLPRKRENLVMEFPLLEFSEYIQRSKEEEKRQNG